MASGIALTTDLIFSTKISGTATALEHTIKCTGNVDQVLGELAAGSVDCVIIDLDTRIEGDQIGQIVVAAGTCPVVAFGSHVQLERLEEARSAGCTRVMARSEFSATLPDLLRAMLETR